MDSKGTKIIKCIGESKYINPRFEIYRHIYRVVSAQKQLFLHPI